MTPLLILIELPDGHPWGDTDDPGTVLTVSDPQGRVVEARFKYPMTTGLAYGGVAE